MNLHPQQNPAQNAEQTNQLTTNAPLLLGAVAVMIGIGIGILGTMWLNQTQTQSATQNSTIKVTTTISPENEANTAAIANESKAADLRVLLNSLYQNHQNLLISAARKDIQGNPDYQATYRELLQNASALAAVMGSIYGPDAEQRFLATWNSQNELYIDYAVAVKNGKQADKDKAFEGLVTSVNEVSALYNNLSPNLPKDGIQSLVGAQAASIQSSLDAYAKKDYELSYGQEKQAINQATSIADTITTSIVKQYPERF